MDLVRNLPPPALAKLNRFVDVLGKWSQVTDLISPSGFAEVWERHILDSAGLQRLFAAEQRWLDLGSGAGFPGVVIGVLLDGKSSSVVHCVESDRRKCAFLRAAVQTLEIPVKVHEARAEDLTPAVTGPIDVVTARAFAPVSTILRLAEPYMAGGAIAALPRGKSYLAEVEGLNPTRYKMITHRNPLAKAGLVLEVRLRAQGTEPLTQSA